MNRNTGGGDRNPPEVEDSVEKQNLLIRELWKKGDDGIHDMRFLNNDESYYS